MHVHIHVVCLTQGICIGVLISLQTLYIHTYLCICRFTYTCIYILLPHTRNMYKSIDICIDFIHNLHTHTYAYIDIHTYAYICHCLTQEICRGVLISAQTLYIHTYAYPDLDMYAHICRSLTQKSSIGVWTSMGWLRLVGSLKLQISFAKEPYKRDYTLQMHILIYICMHIFVAVSRKKYL